MGRLRRLYFDQPLDIIGNIHTWCFYSTACVVHQVDFCCMLHHFLNSHRTELILTAYM